VVLVFRFIEGYHLFFAGIPFGFLPRILFFPFLVWSLELLEAAILVLVYRYNPAWYYIGDYVYLAGTIKLNYYKSWWIVGCISEFSFGLAILLGLW